MNVDRRPLIAGNWKMNAGGQDACPLASAVAKASREADRVDVVVGPPFTALAAVAHELDEAKSRVTIAAQNMHAEVSGAFTGEISSGMLKDAGATWVILGHSERRQLFGETDEGVARKTAAACAAGLRPIVCVGETLEQREAGQTLAGRGAAGARLPRRAGQAAGLRCRSPTSPSGPSARAAWRSRRTRRRCTRSSAGLCAKASEELGRVDAHPLRRQREGGQRRGAPRPARRRRRAGGRGVARPHRLRQDRRGGAEPGRQGGRGGAGRGTRRGGSPGRALVALPSGRAGLAETPEQG